MLIGWRWQSPRSEESLVALKGLAYLRNEILRVQDRVYVLEDEVLKTKLLYNRFENNTVVDHNDLEVKENFQKLAVSKDLEHQETGLQNLEHKEVEPYKVEHKKDLKGAEPIQKARVYSINPQEQRERGNNDGKRWFDEKEESRLKASDNAPQANRHISGKFREVIELAAHGQRVPEIAQRLLISQDAVRMVLSMQSKGG